MSADPRAARVRAAFTERFGRPPEILVRAPGRVVLLGAHIDHQQAEVLPAAIDKAVFLAAARRPDRRLRLAALDLETRYPVVAARSTEHLETVLAAQEAGVARQSA